MSLQSSSSWGSVVFEQIAGRIQIRGLFDFEATQAALERLSQLLFAILYKRVIGLR